MIRMVKPAELARMLGVSKTAVSKALKCGRITLGDGGLVDADVALEQLKSNTRPSTAHVSRNQKYTAARARREHALANIAELRERELTGNLIRVDEVKNAANEAGIILRARLQTVTDRLPALLSGKTLEETAAIIEVELDGVLVEVAGALDKAAPESKC